MSATPVAPGVWRITTPLPFRPREVHAYLAALDGGGFLLVDGGVDTDAAWEALDVGVLEVAGGWERVKVHAVTHMHLDHMGLVSRIRRASRPRLLMGRLDAERAAHAAAAAEEEATYRASLLRGNGAPAEVVAALEASRAGAADLARFVPPDDVPDGESGQLPGAPGWEWVWTPGHTAGHVSLYRRADRVLVAGDAVLPRITPTIGVNRQSDDPVADYLGALERLARLAPRSALPGHGDPIEEPAARLDDLRAATEEETERVLEVTREAPASAWEIAARRHPGPDLPLPTRMLAFRETLAHLQRLAARGAVRTRELADGVRAFARA